MYPCASKIFWPKTAAFVMGTAFWNMKKIHYNIKFSKEATIIVVDTHSNLESVAIFRSGAPL